MNAYVSVVFKKLRNLRKRAARVDEIEALAKQGRELDESQMGALLGKDALLSLIKELESIHTSLLEIETSSPPSQSQDLEIAKAVEEKLKMEGKEVEGVTKPSDGTNFDGNSGSEKILSRQNMSDIQERIRMVVLLLQVGANFTSQTGKPMPPEVEYFYSLIHGKASVSDFTATIEQSLKCAGMFIFPEKAVGVNVLGGVTYDQLLAKVKSMAIEMGWQDPSVVNPDHAHSTAFDSIEGAEERKEPGGGVESRDSLGSARLSGNGNDRRKPKTKATSKRGQSVALKEGIEQDAAQAKEDGEKENETSSSKALQNDEEVAKIAEQRHAHNFEGSAVIEGIDIKRGEDSASNGADTLSGASPVAQNNKERVKRARGTRGGRKSNSKGKQKNDDNTNVSQTGSLTPSQTQRENKKKVNKSANASTSKSSKETDISGEGKGQREKVFGDKGGGDDASSSMKQPGAKSGAKSGKDPVGESGNATTATAAAAAEGQVRISASAIKRRRGKKTTDGQGRGQGTAPSTGKTTPDTAKAAQKDSTSPKA